MASVRQTDTGRWQAVFAVKENGRSRQITRNFGSRAEAQTFANDIGRRLGRSAAPPKELTVNELCNRFATWCADGRTAKTTASVYRRALGYALPDLGAMAISRVSAEHLDQLYGRLRTLGGAEGQPLAPRTVRLVHRSLHRLFGLAVKWQLLTANPAALATSPTVPYGRAKAPSLEQVAALIASARPEPYPQIVALAVGSGLRRGELCGLRWSDIDLVAGTLTVSQVVIVVDSQYEIRPLPKTKSAARTISLDAGLLDILQQWRARLAEQMLALGIGWGPEALLFPDLRQGSCGTPRSPDVVSARVSYLARKAGFPAGVTGLHSLRHRHASSLMHLPIRMVADRLGHSTVVITGNLYMHSDEATRRATSDAAGVVFGDIVRLANRNEIPRPAE